MELTFLGTGTSTGVPQLMCDCEVCRSTDPRDRRMRCSALLESDGHKILIDCGPDFYEQMLRFNRHGNIDALLVTHMHYDHVGGTDDLRPYCKGKQAFPIYCDRIVEDDLHRRMPYCFVENPYPGVPKLEIHRIDAGESFSLFGLEIIPFRVMHARLPILGFKIGNLAYITDAKDIPEETFDIISGVDTLVVNALRHEPHMSHMSLDDALGVIEHVGPRVAYLTHISHQLGLTATIQPTLPPGVFLANDGCRITV